MLLRGSCLHRQRMRRWAIVLIVAGIIFLAASGSLHALQGIWAEQQRAAYLEHIWLQTPVQLSLDLPFLTENQARVYAPGQTAVAFVSGFQPHEALFVRLYHRTQGLLEAYQSRADVLGQVVLSRSLSGLPGEQGYTPTGSLWFEVIGLSGLEQVYPFRLEVDEDEGATLPTKGVYPESAVPGSVVLLWCSGQTSGEASVVTASVDDKPLRPQSLRLKPYPVASDGLLLAALTISLDDPTGEWVVYLNACKFSFSVQ